MVRTPPADGQRDEDLFGGAPHDVVGRRALVDGRGDVEEGELVGALREVLARELDRIAHVAEVLEVDALDDAAGGDVEARDDAADEAHQSLAAWIAVTRIARAPIAYRASITWLTPLRGLMTRTATHSGSRSGEIVGDSMPGATATACVDEVRGQVVVDQHVALGDHHAAQAAQQRLGAVGLLGSGDQHRLGLEQHRAEDLEARLLERRPRRDDVGDGIRHSQAHGRLDRAVQRHEVDRDAALVEEAVDEARIRRRDARALEVLDRREASGRTREAERRVAEAERLDLAGARHPRVEEQVATRDADVERARADVRRDVLRAEVEELDLVLRVDDVEVLGVAAAGVAGLVEHLGGGVGERSLVGHGDSQHGCGAFGVVADVGRALRDVGRRPRG